MSDVGVVTRLELKQAIERGVRAAGFEGEEAAALRKVGEEAKRVAVGRFVIFTDNCRVGCPLDQAKLVRFEEGFGATNFYHREFYREFDSSFNRDYQSLSVVDE